MTKKVQADLILPKVLTCGFVEVSSLVPEAWKPWFWESISTNAPFSWGDNNRTLVTASAFRRHCEDCLLDARDDYGVTQKSINAFLKTLRALGETYVDLEG